MVFGAGALVAAAGLAAVEVFGLNKSPKRDLAGVGETTGLAAAAASAFLRPRRVLGEAAGEADVDAAAVVGEAAALDFLAVRCFAGAGD